MEPLPPGTPPTPTPLVGQRPRPAAAVDLAGVLPKQRLPVGAAKRLAELAGDWFLFTPAILYLRAGFQDGFLADFLHELGAAAEGGGPFFRIGVFDRPLFGGLESPGGNPVWNYAIWAVPEPFGEKLRDFLCALTLIDRGSRDIASVAVRDVDAADPLPGPGEEPGSVTVAAFGIRSGRESAGFSPAGLGPPSLLVLPPLPGMVRLRAQVFADDAALAAYAAKGGVRG